MRSLTHVTVLVDDRDEAQAFYTDVLGFETRSDDAMGDGERWLTVAPPDGGVELTLVVADTDATRAALGRQAGDHVLFVLATDDCRAAYERLVERGVTVHGAPTEQPWGTEVTFEDPYGNVYDLLEPAG